MLTRDRNRMWAGILTAAMFLTTVIVGPAEPAAALTEVTWVGEGTIERVDFMLDGAGIEVGDPFTFTFTFDLDAVDASDADPTRGDYYDLISSMFVTIGDLEWSTTAPTSSYWWMKDGYNGIDGWDVRANGGWTGAELGDPFNPWVVKQLQQFLLFTDEQATVFDSDSLLASPPPLSAFEREEFVFAFVDEDSFTQTARGEVTSLVEEGATDGNADLSGSLDLVHGDVDDDGEVPVGTDVTYRLLVSNLGPDPATEVKAVLWLPSDLPAADVLSIPSSCTFFEGASGAIPGQIECEIGGLAADASGFWSGDIQLHVSSVGPFTVSINRLESTTTDPDNSNDTDEVTLDVRTLTADLRSNVLVVAGDGDEDGVVTVGSDVTFSVSASNDGPDLATNTNLTIWLPGDVTESDLDAVPLGCVFFQGGQTSPTQLSCDLGTVGVGLSSMAIRQFTVTMPSTGPFTVNVASLTSDEFDPDDTNNTSAVTLDVRSLQADLYSNVSVISGDPDEDGEVPVGAEVRFSAGAFNNGPDPATDTRMVVWLPGDVTESDLDAVPLGCEFHQGGLTLPTQLDCDLGTIGTGPFDFWSVAFTVTIPSTGPFTVNVATLTSNEFDTDETNNTSGVTLDVRVAQADLEAGINPTGGNTASLGEPVTYAVSVENLGPDAAPDTTVEMQLFAPPTYFELGTLPIGCTADTTINPPTVTCSTDLTVPDGEVFGPDSGVFFIDVTWLEEGNWQVDTVVSSPAFDPDSSNDVASSTVEVVGAEADLETSILLSTLSDVDQDGDMWRGDVARYGITVANLGPDPAPDTTVIVVVHAEEGTDFSFVSSVGCTRSAVDLDGPTYTCDVGDVGTGVFDFLTVSLWLEWHVPGTFEIEAFANSPSASDPDAINTFSKFVTTVQDPDGDFDGDGIANSIDGFRSDPADFNSFVYLDGDVSPHFSDRAVLDGLTAGTTFGEVEGVAAAFELFDAPDPSDGITALAFGDPSETLTLDLCGVNVVHLVGGTDATFTCGSLIVEVQTGMVTVELEDGVTLEVSAGSTVTVDEGAVTVDEGSAVLTEDGVDVTLEEGSTTSDPGADPDGDGLTTFEELYVGTDPEVADTDDDGVVDGQDVDWLLDAVNDFKRRDFANGGAIKAIRSILEDVDAHIRAGDLAEAASLIDVLIKRSDGCGYAPDDNDWIVNCETQQTWRLLLGLLLREVTPPSEPPGE